jgi:uncharacterized Zn-binding protein involved in type VI secretion
MPANLRVGSLCSGHGCFPPRPADSGSPNVFINGEPLHRIGDHWAPHGCPPFPPNPGHDGRLIAGSPNTFANNKLVGRVGDAISCGSIAAVGSPNTFTNG